MTASLLSVWLLGCSGSTTAPEPDPKTVEAPAPVSAPPPAPRVKDVCREAFDPDGATTVFGKLASLKTDCTFEGVNVQQSRMKIQWYAGETLVEFGVTPLSCAQKNALPVAKTDGAIALLRPEEAVRSLCPDSFAQLAAKVEAGGLVKPVEVGAPVVDPN